jgi:hypothetical protein
LTAYKDGSTTSPASVHAATQLLRRLKWLRFEGNISDIVQSSDFILKDDLWYDEAIINKMEKIVVKNVVGARPYADIFDRPILRCRAPRKGASHLAPWDNHASISFFSSALEAAQELSFGSKRVRHTHGIDDVQIANNIAHSAAGEKTESYNYLWSWEDTAGEIQRNLERQKSTESFLQFPPQNRAIAGFGLVLGGLCACDTTTDDIIEEYDD